MEELVIERLSVAPILANISLTIEPGKVLAIVGPSGCGKSTLVHAIAGVVPSTGSIVMGEELNDLPMHRRPTGTVFQDSVLFPDHDVWDNVAFGLDDARMKDSQRRDLVDLTLAQLNILGLAHMNVEHLSGGQAQRVALARTLVRRPRILLLDEPLVHVDPTLRASIQTDIIEQVRRHRLATLYVTHDVEEACRLGDVMAIMDRGRILQCASPAELYRQPASAFAARMMGIPNILSAKINGADRGAVHVEFGRTWLTLPTVQALSPGRADVVVPPETIELTDAGKGQLAGRVIRSIFARTHMEYEVETPVGTVVVTEPETTHPRAVGDELGLNLTYCWFIADSSAATT
ncbi:ABC transporter ATP-binding protein [Trueperella abortisuis]|uniref:ABC transporter ATP-binding protein n=1 Tax=Trueperella abortisuis TaxID=445930 RepID=UPI002892E6E0|nr:ABC transporter ATP-binding protein [Trueperella abortisuis]